MVASGSANGLEVDVVVIGSGFGGAAVACRLAQAGQTVVALEQGRHYPAGRGNFKAARHGTSQIRHGHLMVDVLGGMNVVRGIGVGGGSLHYFGVRLRTPPEIFERQWKQADGTLISIWPQGITRKALDPYYDLAELMVPADHTQPHPVLGPPPRSEMFLKAAGKSTFLNKKSTILKNNPDYVDIAVNTSQDEMDTEVPVLDPITNAPVKRKRCVYSGECLLGCPPSKGKDGGNVNARALLTLNYLAVAEQQGAKIFPLHRADLIHLRPDGRFQVDFTWFDPRRYDESEGEVEVGDSGNLIAKRVVLAAGTLGSVELLLKCRDRGTGLTDPLSQLPKLGYYFSGNGDFTIAKTTNTPQDLQPKAGPSITVGGDFSTDDGHKIFIEDVGVIPFIEAVFGTQELTATTPDTHSIGYLAMCEDLAYGMLSLQKIPAKPGVVSERLLLDWHPGLESIQRYEEVIARLVEMSQLLGGDYKDPESYDPLTGTGLMTLHPLGGAIMSDDAKTGVVNPKGEVHTVPGLYVADASIIPTALGVNPSFTISALAERIAYWIVNPDGPDLTGGETSWPPA
jgi:cholesterol oxidase